MKIRMSQDVEALRFYKNLSDCFSKMKKYEGKKSFYQGFTIGFLHLYAQINLTKQLFD